MTSTLSRIRTIGCRFSISTLHMDSRICLIHWRMNMLNSSRWMGCLKDSLAKWWSHQHTFMKMHGLKNASWATIIIYQFSSQARGHLCRTKLLWMFQKMANSWSAKSNEWLIQSFWSCLLYDGRARILRKWSAWLLKASILYSQNKGAKLYPLEKFRHVRKGLLISLGVRMLITQ